jgi:hypothetical protein
MRNLNPKLTRFGSFSVGMKIKLRWELGFVKMKEKEEKKEKKTNGEKKS